MFRSLSVKRLLNLILSFVFLWQLYEATFKLTEGLTATTIAYKPQKYIDFPSMTFCSYGYFETPNVSMSLKAYYEEYLQREEEIILELIVSTNWTKENRYEMYQRSYKRPDYFKKIQAEYKGHTFFEKSYISAIGYLIKCETFNPPPNLDIGTDTTIQFFLHLRNYHQVLVKMHEKNQLTSPFDRHMGTTNLILDDTRIGQVLQHELAVKRIVNLNKNDARCTETNSEKFSICRNEYLKKTMECRLPWEEANNPSGQRECDKESDLAKYMELSGLFGSPNMSVILKKTGCKLNCEYTTFKHSLMSSVIISEGVDKVTGYTFDKSTTISLGIMIIDPYVREEKEHLIYDSSSFIGNVGGYLGLLMGLSLLDVYFLVVTAIERLLQQLK